MKIGFLTRLIIAVAVVFLLALVGVIVGMVQTHDAMDVRQALPTPVARNHLDRWVQWLMVLVGSGLATLVAFAYYIRRYVLKPLQQLEHHAQRIALGDYAARCDIQSRNELAELGTHFNAMAHAIEDDVAHHEAVQDVITRANTDLAEGKLLLQQILDTSSVGIFMVDMNGLITHANRSMQDMFRWPAGELVGQEYVALVEPSQRGVGRRMMLELLGGTVDATDVQRRYRRADGTEFWGHLTGRRFLDIHGQSQGLVGVVVDITEKVWAQQRQQQHNEVMQLLLEKAPMAVALDAMVRNVEAINPVMLCSILLLDAQGRHLHHGAAPRLPDFFIRALDGTAIGPGVGSCGAAAHSGQRVIVENISTHPWWAPYAALARSADLAACWSQPIVSAQGQVLGTFAIYHRQPCAPNAMDLQLIEDEARLASVVIEKVRAEDRLQLAARVFTHAREGIVITDAQQRIVEVNAMFTQITGYSREEALGSNPRKLLQSGRHSDDFYAARKKEILDHGFWTGEVWNQRKNGEVFAEMLTISLVRDAQGAPQNYVALFTDITPMKEHQRQLEHIAHFDSLTNMPNRVLLADRLEYALTQCLRREHAVAVVYLDLDGFKAVNDLHGHGVGDTLLVTLAQRMRAVLRETDTLARIGGDEFVAVLVDLVSVQETEPVLQRLLKAASAPVDVGDLSLQVSASIGVTTYPHDKVEADLLLRHADQAMYVAKQAGKNRYHLFDVAQDAAVQSQRESLDHIRRALAQQEFVLFYQPKVNMQTGTVKGAEALVRWQHPQRGLLAPASFLPTLENHSLGVELGEWVIASALQQMARWQAQGLALPVSVNIGARQLQQTGFAARLAGLLAAQPEVAPQQLELEILETSVLEDLVQVCQTINDCQALGVRFALDDFGTGYSSLTHLRHLPAEVIKIDQSFVRDMLEDADDLAIVKGVIGLAAAFHREVIAEGVETHDHGTLLLKLGCAMAQGYAIARPMPAHALPAWVQGWQAHPVWVGNAAEKCE
ncbi:MAG: EAL domain-containing protein [Burkholderiales bacterium]|nr:EAL domain-containing protein [Burkholderiales bacterium]